MNAYTKPSIEVVGSLHDLTLQTFPGVPPGTVKIIGGNLDGIKVKIGGVKFPLGTS